MQALRREHHSAERQRRRERLRILPTPCALESVVTVRCRLYEVSARESHVGPKRVPGWLHVVRHASRSLCEQLVEDLSRLMPTTANHRLVRAATPRPHLLEHRAVPVCVAPVRRERLPGGVELAKRELPGAQVVLGDNEMEERVALAGERNGLPRVVKTAGIAAQCAGDAEDVQGACVERVAPLGFAESERLTAYADRIGVLARGHVVPGTRDERSHSRP